MSHLAWRPFLEPMDAHGQGDALWLLVPLVVGICLFYKAIKVEHVEQLPKEAAKLSLTVLGAMALAAAVLWGVVLWVLG